MTVETTSNTVTFVGNAATTVFPFVFRVPTADDLDVYIDGSASPISPTLYSVTGIDDDAGGTVTYPLSGSPLAAGQTITLTRLLDYTQPVDLTNQDGFYPEVVEGMGDRLEMQIQQLHTDTVANADAIETAVDLFETLINETTDQSLFNTAAAVASATIDAGVGFIQTAGYHAVGDGGNALYKRDTVSTPGALQSADGAWWRLASRPLNILMFGARSGFDCSAAHQAAHDLISISGEDGAPVYIPPGNWRTAATPTTQTSFVRWKGAQGADYSLTSATNCFAGVNTPVNFPINEEFGNFDLGASLPLTQNKFISYHIRDDGVVSADYENQGLWVLTGISDPLNGAVHDGVGIGGRCYMLAEGTRGYAFHFVGLSLAGLTNVGIIGGEIDVTNEGSEINGYDPFQKIGMAIYPTGSKKISSFIELGPAGSTGYVGIHINGSAISSGASTYAIRYDGKFCVESNGAVLVMKDVSNRQTPGVELDDTGAIWGSSTGAPGQLILTRTAVAGNVTTASIFAQQMNSASTVRSMISLHMNVEDHTAGSEDTNFTVDGWRAGVATTLFVANPLFLGPGTDNVFKLGDASHRCTELFSVNNVINTSDANDKDAIDDIDPRVIKAWAKCRPKQFKWKDAIEKKGEKARLHFGLVAQELIAAFEAEGLDPWAYGAICKDEIFEPVEIMVKELQGTGEYESKPDLDADGKYQEEEYRVQAYDEDGQPESRPGKPPMLWKKRIKMKSVQIMKEVDVPKMTSKPTGRYRLSIRPGECQAIENAYQRAELTRLTSELERKLAALSPGQPEASRTSPSPQSPD